MLIDRTFIRVVTTVIISITFIAFWNTLSTVTSKLVEFTLSIFTVRLIRVIPTLVLAVTALEAVCTVQVCALELTGRAMSNS